ncbi:DUF4931 domain-containing protein [Candidatus Woesearchaeota archaeon]|nr:DUF4931 domain-containing protein [Candidatus Woesearchaeota archaeon]
MNSIRKDYILDRWVVVAEARGKRPHEFESSTVLKPGTDFFAPGNEHLTPPEIGRLESKKGVWKLRWFPNKFSAVSDEKFALKKGKKYLQEIPAYGVHEIIAETRSSEKQLWDLPEKDIADLFKVYRERIKALLSKKNIKYVQVFKNHGKDGGTSLIHSHSQVVGIPKIPQAIEEKLAGMRKNKVNYSQIVKLESKSERKAIETRHFAAICPWASRFNYEIWVLPKKHYNSLEEMPDKVISDLAKTMKKILSKLKEIKAPYNYYLNYAPKGKKMLFHIEITPRLATWAGFEFSTGFVINSVAPEDAARFYKSK